MHMTVSFAALISISIMSGHSVWAQAVQPGRLSKVDLERRYRAGETLQYRMKGSNRGWEYQITARDAVKQDLNGIFYESIGWSDLQSNAPMTLSAASLASRQTLSLTPANSYLAVPDLSQVQPFLIGPMTDLLTFYSDLFLANTLKLSPANPHVYFEHGRPNSWADGTRVIVGQDSIDFDLTLVSTDAEEHTALLLVRHVPPKHPQVLLPAEWMQAPVGDTPNNFVQVEHTGSRYTAEVGQEKFEVRIAVDTRDGKILSVQLHNPVSTVTRECEDAALLHCDAAKPNTILREVSLALVQ